MGESSSSTGPLGLPIVRRIHREPGFYFALALVVTVAGFWPSFFSQLSSAPTAHLVHGFTATGWMIVPILQAWLIRSGRLKLHRTVGRWSLVLAALVVISGLRVVQMMTLRNFEEFHPYRIKFVFYDLTTLAMFLLFIALAIRSARKHDVASHLRYMAGTVILALEPALDRLFLNLVPAISNFDEALYAALISLEVLLAGLIALEWRSGRIRPPFPILLAYIAVMHVSATPVASNPSFQEFAVWFASL